MAPSNAEREGPYLRAQCRAKRGRIPRVERRRELLEQRFDFPGVPASRCSRWRARARPEDVVRVSRPRCRQGRRCWSSGGYRRTRSANQKQHGHESTHNRNTSAKPDRFPRPRRRARLVAPRRVRRARWRHSARARLEPCEDWRPYIVAAIPKPVSVLRAPTERKTGFEPATLSLARRCATTAPLPRELR